MSKLDDIPHLLAAAEQAAASGDLASADARLKDIARIQEAELGADHPDLASTMNNLAVVAEQTGRPDDAEACYRRAVAIASKSLPADDPTVAATRQNLEDFCRARGIPIDRPAVSEPAAPAPKPEPMPIASAPTPATVPVAPPREPEPVAVAPAAKPAPAPVRAEAVVGTAPPRPHSTITIAIAAVALVAAALFVIRPWASREPSPPAPRTAIPSAEPAPPPPSPPATPERTQPTEPAPPAQAPPPIEQPPRVDKARPAPASAVSLATVELCRRLSTSGRAWRCDPAGDRVAPGSLTLYTRVRSPRDAVVVHRWFRGDALRQSVRLEIDASPAEGYRTYSRQSVDRGEWRVEVTDAAGRVLHEQRIAVR
jgi:hypothetical protein